MKCHKCEAKIDEHRNSWRHYVHNESVIDIAGGGMEVFTCHDDEYKNYEFSFYGRNLDILGFVYCSNKKEISNVIKSINHMKKKKPHIVFWAVIMPEKYIKNNVKYFTEKRIFVVSEKTTNKIEKYASVSYKKRETIDEAVKKYHLKGSAKNIDANFITVLRIIFDLRICSIVNGSDEISLKNIELLAKEQELTKKEVNFAIDKFKKMGKIYESKKGVLEFL